MQLCNVHIVGKEGLYNLRIDNEIITAISENKNYSEKNNEPSIYFNDAIAFPGLINSHDHLDFNLFPQTGNRIYNNYIEWGKDIQHTNRKQIDAVLKIPQPLRIQWGMYKNLFNGITTVVNHGAKLHIADNFITTLQSSRSLHSVEFEKNWKLKLNHPFAKKQIYIIHVGEGTADVAHKEINRLIKWNLLKRKLIAVHGVAMNKKQASAFKALVWCPASNYFLLNKTAAVSTLKKKTSILFGTDSTLTAHWNLWEHLRLARNTHLLNDTELFKSLTAQSASVFNLQQSGKIDTHYIADIVVAKPDVISNNFDSFFSLNPWDIQLILYKGKIMLFDEDIKDQMDAIHFSYSSFSKIYIHEKIKYVYGDVPGLMKQIVSFYPGIIFPVKAL